MIIVLSILDRLYSMCTARARQKPLEEAKNVDDDKDRETNCVHPLSHCRPVHSIGHCTAVSPQGCLWALD